MKGLVSALIAAMCVLLYPQAQAQSDKTVIRIANLDIAPFIPVGYVQKIAAKHGIQVKVTNFRRGLEAAQALKAGEADVAVGGVEAAISAIAGGAPAQIITSVTTGGIAWVSRPDLNINTIADLKGRKFGVIRGLHELVLLKMLEQNNLTFSTSPGADVQLVFINSPPAVNTALKNKEVDAMSNPEPFPSRAVVEGFGKPLLRPYDTPLGAMPRAVFMRGDFLKANPETAQRFVDAVVDATMTLRADPKLARDYAVNEFLKGAITPADWDLAAQNQGYDVSLTADTVQAYIDSMRKYGMIKAQLQASAITELSMLEKSKSRLGWK